MLEQNIEDAFAAVGRGLEISKKSISADVQSVLANVALIVTGQAAGDMNSTMVGVGNKIGEMADAIKSTLGGNSKEDSTVYLKIEGSELKSFVQGEIAKAQKTYAKP